MKGWHLPGVLANGVGDALTTFTANANGQIKPIPLTFIKQLTSEQHISLGGQAIVIPAQSLTAASILIDDNGITCLAQINGQRPRPPQTTSATDFSSFKSAFLAKGGSLLPSAPKDGLVLSPELVKSLFSGFGTSMTPDQRAKASLESAWRSVHRLAGPDLSLVVPAANITAAIAPVLQQALGDAAAKANITLSDSKFVLADGRSAGLLNSVNTVLAGLVSGVSQGLPSIPIDVRPLQIAAIDLKDVAKNTPGLELLPATLPAAEGKLAGAAILIASDGIQILADINLASPNLAARPAGADPGPFSGQIDDIKQAFKQRCSARLADEPVIFFSADVSWARLAEITNARWRGIGGVQAVYHFDTGLQSMTPTEIRLVKKPTYACSQRTCSFHSCANVQARRLRLGMR